jgi:hypothetical protein
MTNQSPDQPPSKYDKESFQEKFKKSLEKFRDNQRVDSFLTHATANTKDTISYILLILGLVLLFFYPFYGGLLIGIIAGLYFSSEILALLRNFSDFVDDQGIVKSLIGAGLLMGLFIAAPAIFIGIALAVALRQILFPGQTQEK